VVLFLEEDPLGFLLQNMDRISHNLNDPQQGTQNGQGMTKHQTFSGDINIWLRIGDIEDCYRTHSEVRYMLWSLKMALDCPELSTRRAKKM
jgi:hypothetical protein